MKRLVGRVYCGYCAGIGHCVGDAARGDPRRPLHLSRDVTAARGAEMYLALWLRLTGALDTAMFNIKVVTR